MAWIVVAKGGYGAYHSRVWLSSCDRGGTFKVAGRSPGGRPPPAPKAAAKMPRIAAFSGGERNQSLYDLLTGWYYEPWLSGLSYWE